MAVAVLGPLAVIVALLTQHIGGLQPCPWCVLQRLEFLAVSALAAVAALLPAGTARRVWAAAAALLALAGVATAGWQHFVAAASNSCRLTLADRIVSALGLDERWPGIFAAYASCADAAVDLLGVPYEAWSGALFAAMAAAAGFAAVRVRV